MIHTNATVSTLSTRIKSYRRTRRMKRVIIAVIAEKKRNVVGARKGTSRE